MAACRTRLLSRGSRGSERALHHCNMKLQLSGTHPRAHARDAVPCGEGGEGGAAMAREAEAAAAAVAMLREVLAAARLMRVV